MECIFYSSVLCTTSIEYRIVNNARLQNTFYDVACMCEFYENNQYKNYGVLTFLITLIKNTFWSRTPGTL